MAENFGKANEPTNSGSKLIWALFAAYSIYTLWALYTAFLAGKFGMEDLGILSDILSNTLWHGRPFYFADADMNHLKIHFTPTLFLLTPAFWVQSSRFAFVILCSLAVFASIAAFLSYWLHLSRTHARDSLSLVIPFLILLYLSLNQYTLSLLYSAHFESLYLCFASLLVVALLKEWRLWQIGVLFVLCLGVRQDCGIFLAFLLAALFFVPPSMRPSDQLRFRGRLVGLSLASLFYAGIAIAVVLPALGEGSEHMHARRFWSHYGDSWLEIAIHMVTSPQVLIEDISRSAFLPINRTFSFLSFLNPAFALFENLPGIIFYSTSDWAKKYLKFYNSALLLPGFFLGVLIGFHKIYSFTQTRNWCPRRKTLLAACLAILALYSTLRHWPKTEPQSLKLYSWSEDSHLNAVLKDLESCPEIVSVATESPKAVFMPTRFMAMTLPSSPNASAIFYRHTHNKGYWVPSGFRLLSEHGDYKLYVREAFACKRG